MSSQREMILNLLHNLGSRREVSKYLDAFAETRDAPPVIIKVGGAIIENRLDELATALACLGHVGIRPIVLHGAGPQLSRALAEVGVTPEFKDGHRVTTPETLGVAHRVFADVSARLAAEIGRRGIPARPVERGVFKGKRVDDPELGLVGRVTGVGVEPIESARRADIVPILSPLAHSHEFGALNVNADVATRELAIALQAQKVVFLTGTDGLLDEHGKIIPTLTLADDYERLMNEQWVSGGMRLKLSEISALLAGLPAASSVAITSPQHLASELFTHRGSGTLVRRGFEIRKYTTLESLDTDRLANTIAASFDRPLQNDYFRSRRIERVLVAGEYSAAAVLTSDGPAPYLDKFAVSSEAQGQGIAGSLWKRLCESPAPFFWRSRTGNGINPWYTARASGMQRAGEWVVFWRGLRAPSEIGRAVRYALALEDSFAPVKNELKEVPLEV